MPTADRAAEAEQLAALRRIHELLEDNEVEYWLFGGWAVDFHAGTVTREHDDLDLAAWVEDADQIAALLHADDWLHAPDPQEDGYTVYERSGLRLELAFIARGEDGHVYTPLRSGRAAWPDGAFQDELLELRGVRARVIALGALEADKSAAHDDPVVAAKDRADVVALSRVARRRG